MLDPLALEESFQEFVTHLPQMAPDGIIDIDLQLLQSLNLLNVQLLEHQVLFPSYSDQFYMIEADDKLTLFNQEFVIWMLPSASEDEESATYVFIALNQEDKPQLELVFLASGVYNTSWLVLTVLDAFLKEVKENQETLARFES